MGFLLNEHGRCVTMPNSSSQKSSSVARISNARLTDGYAEYAAASADMIAEKPRSLDYRTAAVVPVVAVTAWQMLHDKARVWPGARVLVLGAGGSVGSFAVQFARQASAVVVATASAADAEYIHGLGAVQTIDYRAVTSGNVINPVDIVIDTVGGDAQKESFNVLKSGGILVSCVSPPDKALARQYGVRGAWFLVDVRQSYLSRISGMFDLGELTVRVGTELKLADARVAHEMLTGLRPRARGKIVLRVGDE